MNIAHNVTRATAVVAALSALLLQGPADAQEGRKPISFLTMVCHESGGSGAPLTDYVNNIDYALLNTQTGQLQSSFPAKMRPIYTETNPGADGLPTSCAVATAVLTEYGLTLTQSFSHFPGYYIEIFTN